MCRSRADPNDANSDRVLLTTSMLSPGACFLHMGDGLWLPDDLEPHESGVRKLVAETHGESYRALASLDEARQHEDAYVGFEGDDGGQIYAVFPVAAVQCEEATLRRLLADLDSIAWPRNDPDSARVFYERHPAGHGITGGKGGGLAKADGWVHHEFEELRVADQIRDVISGTRHRLDFPTVR
jgi:hypothetical protein